MNLGKETTAVVDGVTYTFGRMELGVLKEFFAWIEEKEGDVFADLERFIDKLPEAERGKLFRERQDRADQIKSLNLDSPVAQAHKKTAEGIGLMAALLLRAKHPDITPAKAFLVMQSLDPGQIQKIEANARGRSPAKNAGSPVVEERQPGISTGETKPTPSSKSTDA